MTAHTEPARGAWARVSVLALHQLVAWGVLFYAYTVLAGSIAASLSLSRTRVAATFSLALLAGGLAARRVGAALDRLGPRRVMAFGAALSATSFAALTLAHGVVGLAICFVALGIGHSMVLYEAAFRAVLDWFPRDEARRKALLLVTIVGGFASTVFLPLTHAFVVSAGWRPTVLTLTGIFALASAITCWVMPTDTRSVTTAAPVTPRPLASVRWLAVAFALQSFAGTGLLVHLVPYLTERWSDGARAALFAGLAGAAQVPGRVFVGLRPAAPSGQRLIVLFALQAVGLALLGAPLEATAIAALFAFGLASGMMTLERANLVADWYGREEYATRGGQILAPSMVLRAAAPFVVEIARVQTGGYRAPFVGLATLLAIGACAAALAVRSHRVENATAAASW